MRVIALFLQLCYIVPLCCLKLRLSPLSYQIAILRSNNALSDSLNLLYNGARDRVLINDLLKPKTLCLMSSYQQNWLDNTRSGMDQPDFAVDEFPVEANTIEWLKETKVIPKDYFVVAKESSQTILTLLLNNVYLLDNHEFLRGCGSLIRRTNSYWAVMRELEDLWLLINGETMMWSPDDAENVLKLLTYYRATSKNVLKEGGFLAADLNLQSKLNLQLSLFQLHRFISSFLYVEFMSRTIADQQAQLLSILKNHIRSYLYFFEQHRFLINLHEEDEAMTDLVQCTIDYGIWILEGTGFRRGNKMKSYLDKYWKFILSKNHDSIIIKTAAFDVLIELVTFESHGTLLKYWRKLSSLKIALPNRIVYPLLMMVLRRAWIKSSETYRILAKALLSRLQWPVGESFMLINERPSFFGLFYKHLDDCSLRKAFRHALIQTYSSEEMELISTFLGVKIISRDTIISGFIKVLEEHFLVGGRIGSKAVILPKFEIHPYIEKMFWCMINMSVILRIRLPFILHDSYVSTVLSKDVDYSYLYKELMSRQFADFSNQSPETKISIRNLQVLYCLSVSRKVLASAESFEEFKTVSGEFVYSDRRSDLSVLETMGCIVWNAKPHPFIPIDVLGYMTPELYRTMLFY